jgi:plastocyanin
MRVSTASVFLLCLLFAGCGSSGTGTPSPVPAPVPAAPTPAPAPAPTPAGPSDTASVSITQFGLIPFEANVIVGGRVMFVNNDNVPHDIQGGPDPDHRDCPEIDVVGFLTPGQSRQTNPLPSARTCQYHDHTVHDDHHGFEGRIVIH